MNTTSDPASVDASIPVRPRRRWLRRLAWSSVISILVLSVAWQAWLLVATRARDAAIADIAASGRPTSFAQIIPPPVAADRNAALLIEQANLLMTQPGTAKSNQSGDLRPELIVLINEWANAGSKRRPTITSQENGKPVKRALSIGQAALDTPAVERRAILAQINGSPWWPVIEQAASMPECRFSTDYGVELPAGILLPHLSMVRNQVRIATLRAVLLAAEGDGDAAVRSLGVALALGRRLGVGERSLLISQLVASSCDRMVVRAVEDVLVCRPMVNDAAWKDLSDHLEVKEEPSAWFAECIDNERAGLITNLLVIDSHLSLWSNQPILGLDDSPGIPASQLLHTSLVRPWLRRDMAHCLRAMSDMRALAAGNGGIKEMEAMTQEKTRGSVIAGMMLPAMGLVMKQFFLCREQTQLARMAIACERHRMANGQLPMVLSEVDRVMMPSEPGLVDLWHVDQKLVLEIHDAEAKGLIRNDPSQRDRDEMCFRIGSARPASSATVATP